MTLKGILLTLIVVALAVRMSVPIRRACVPTGYEEFQPLISFNQAEDTNLLWMYLLYSPKKPRKLDRCEKLYRKRCLILMLLLIAGIEQNPGEFSIFILLQSKFVKERTFPK